MDHFLPHVATRVFGTPLLIQPRKLDVILRGIGPRLGLDPNAIPATADGPGDPASRKPYSVTEDGIAVISIVGSLVRRGFGAMNAYSGLTSYDDLQNEFLDAVTDPTIRAILLDIDSPGGEAGGCFDLSDLIYSQRGQKPIYAVADEDCYSAAYAIGSAADKLFVTRTGGVGSVGVICLHVDQSQADQKDGFRYTAIFAGDHKNDLSPHEPLSTDAKDFVQAEVDRLYGMFVSAVSRNRGVSAAVVRSTEARCYFGDQGVTAGFADGVGTFADALQALRQSFDDDDDEEPDDDEDDLVPMVPRRMPIAAGNNGLSAVLETHDLSTAGTSVAANSNQGGSDTPVPDQPITADLTAAPSVDATAHAAAAPTHFTPPSIPAYTAEDAEEVLQLCTIAKLPLSAATEYVSAKVKPAEVRKQLAARKAQETEAVVITSAVTPAMSTQAAPQENFMLAAVQSRIENRERSWAEQLIANSRRSN